MHILFIDSGEERVYDISAAAGGPIPLGAGLAELKSGALLMNCIYAVEIGEDEEGNPLYDTEVHDIMEYDISGGKCRFFDLPDLPEFVSLFD